MIPRPPVKPGPLVARGDGEAEGQPLRILIPLLRSASSPPCVGTYQIIVMRQKAAKARTRPRRPPSAADRQAPCGRPTRVPARMPSIAPLPVDVRRSCPSRRRRRRRRRLAASASSVPPRRKKPRAQPPDSSAATTTTTADPTARRPHRPTTRRSWSSEARTAGDPRAGVRAQRHLKRRTAASEEAQTMPHAPTEASFVPICAKPAPSIIVARSASFRRGERHPADDRLHRVREPRRRKEHARAEVHRERDDVDEPAHDLRILGAAREKEPDHRKREPADQRRDEEREEAALHADAEDEARKQEQRREAPRAGKAAAPRERAKTRAKSRSDASAWR